MKGSAAELLTAAEAAELLSVCTRTVRRLGWRGDLPVVRVGHAVRFRLADLRALIDQSVHDERPDVTPGVREFSTLHHQRHEAD